MIVNELAQRADTPSHVVRYYTRIGLLEPTRHPENGYKLFDGSHVRRLRFIRRTKLLGFTLNEIAELLDDATHGDSPCPRAREIIERRIDENRRKLDEMIALQQRMELALTRWKEMPDKVPDGHVVCHLIETVNGN